MKVGIQLNFYLGQRVIYDGMAGSLKSLSIEQDGIMCTVVLDDPIIIPPEHGIEREIKIYTQHVPIHELRAA